MPDVRPKIFTFKESDVVSGIRMILLIAQVHPVCAKWIIVVRFFSFFLMTSTAVNPTVHKAVNRKIS